MRGLSTEENLHFKIDWASLIVGRKFTVFALFYFEFEGNFPSKSPRGAYVWRGDLTEGFLRYRIGGLIHGGAFFQPRPHSLREKPWERGWLFFGISRYHLMLSGNFCGSESRHCIFGGLNFGPGIFGGFV